MGKSEGHHRTQQVKMVILLQNPELCLESTWLVVSTFLKNISQWEALSHIYIILCMENKRCLKPPTRTYSSMFWHVCWFEEQEKNKFQRSQHHPQHTGSKPIASAVLRGPLAFPWRISSPKSSCSLINFGLVHYHCHHKHQQNPQSSI